MASSHGENWQWWSRIAGLLHCCTRCLRPAPNERQPRPALARLSTLYGPLLPSRRPIVSDGAVDHEDGIDSVQIEKQVHSRAALGPE